MFARTLILFPILFALGCATIGPDYRAPEAPRAARDATLRVDSEPELTANEPAHDWWMALSDPTLNALVEAALDENREIRVAAARVAEAEAFLERDRAEYLPTVGADAGLERRQVGGAAFGSDDNFVPNSTLASVGIRAGWELDYTGRVRRLTESAAANADAAEMLRRDTQVLVAASTTNTYMVFRGAQLEEETAVQNLMLQQQILELAIARAEEGVASELDAQRAQAQIALSRATIPPLQARQTGALARLVTLTGLSIEDVAERLAEGYRSLPTPPRALPVGDARGLLSRRSDVRAAEYRLRAATAQIGVAQAEYFPRVSMGGTVGLSAQSIPGLAQGSALGFGVGPSISWNLNFGAVAAQIDAADARARGALAAYEHTVLEALEETRTAISGYGRELVRYRTLSDASQRAAGAETLVRLRFEEGYGSFGDVLLESDRRLQAEAALAESRTAVALRYGDVYRALGAGWR
ncbi:MAG: TolC family protein [Myxococcota bacterium]